MGNPNVSDVLNASLVAEIEAYFARNAHRDPAVVKQEVFGILNSVFRDRLHLQGGAVRPLHPALQSRQVHLVGERGRSVGMSAILCDKGLRARAPNALISPSGGRLLKIVKTAALSPRKGLIRPVKRRGLSQNARQYVRSRCS